MSSEIILINISGANRAGLTSELLAVLGSRRLDLLDVGQAVIHNSLNLAALVGVPSSSAEAVLDGLRAAVRALGLQVRFKPVSRADYAAWVGREGAPRYILTLLGRRLDTDHLGQVAAVVAEHGLSIDAVRRLSGRVPLVDQELAEQGQPEQEWSERAQSGEAQPERGQSECAQLGEARSERAWPVAASSKACVECSLRGRPGDVAVMRSDLMKLALALDVDISVQADDIFRRHRRLVCFDMDSTLIEAEVVDELARCAGVAGRVGAITERAMRGELDFCASLRERVAQLAGLPERCLDEVAGRLPLMEGAERLFAMLNRLGYRTAILSGGFDWFGRVLQARLGVDHVYANRLEIRDGRLSGRVLEPIIDGGRKAQLLDELAQLEGISREQVIAVGDGANDIPMLSRAGLGIAFRAKPLVRESAHHAISSLGLDSILYLMGIHDRETGGMVAGVDGG